MRAPCKGGPLSPILANVLLDEVDKELEKRGHALVRCTDDLNIYFWSKQAGERVMKAMRATSMGSQVAAVARSTVAVIASRSKPLSIAVLVSSSMKRGTPSVCASTPSSGLAVGKSGKCALSDSVKEKVTYQDAVLAILVHGRSLAPIESGHYANSGSH
jgi:hypothetical protein